ncbi:uncharacterized protein BX663DRAFT_411021, partial [Cokeromyces recurvatus]|uniref:uncharacterized protein n=1 Tax=Cokeromyces recurvatus TaxID=90255 RepID=UPI00221FD5B0
RMNALRIEQSENLRPRCRWSKDEDSKLLSLVSELGKRWTTISKEFVDRSPSNVANRYFLLTKCEERGPWSSEEIERLRELGRGRTYEEIDDWDEICKKLLRPRPYSLVKMTYKHSLDPRIKHGRWTEEESDRLERLVMRYGEDQMKLVAQLMGTRTKRQCLERWRWQMVNIKKGHFSEQEDKLILNAVKRYGENFAVICKVTGIQRTPRHVSQHYQNFLAPGLDRSPWTPEEEELVHKVCTE